MIRTREEWENWFKTLFAQLDAMQAETYTDILDYKALKEEKMGYSVVEFCQHLKLPGKHGRFYCVVTIIWKLVEDAWKESRWHASLLRTEWE